MVTKIRTKNQKNITPESGSKAFTNFRYILFIIGV
jgi:hypothetical protein